MRKKRIEKLTLHRETLRDLEGELKQVQGGATDKCVSLVTDCNCPYSSPPRCDS